LGEVANWMAGSPEEWIILLSKKGFTLAREKILVEGNAVKASLDFADYRVSRLIEELTRPAKEAINSAG